MSENLSNRASTAGWLLWPGTRRRNESAVEAERQGHLVLDRHDNVIAINSACGESNSVAVGRTLGRRTAVRTGLQASGSPKRCQVGCRVEVVLSCHHASGQQADPADAEANNEPAEAPDGRDAAF